MNTRSIIIIVAAIAIIAIGITFIIFDGFGHNMPTPTTGGTEGGLPIPAGGSSTSASNGSAFINPSSTTVTSSSSQGGNAFSNGNTSTGGNNQASNQASGTTSSGAVPIIAKTSDGATKIFYVKPIQTDSRGDYLLSNYSDYQIVYFPGGSFLISLLNSNLAFADKEAETHFLSLLKIDKKTACAMRVAMNVPYSVNPSASGFDYRLSFCPGTHLP